MANTGSLGIQITADDAQLRAVMRRAAESTTTAFASMGDAASRFKSLLGGIGVAVSAGGLIAFAKNAIDTAAAFDDLSEKTGASVENLSKLDQVARISGSSMDGFEQGLIKLAKSLAGSNEETQGAGKAFAKLGLDMKALQGLDTAEALRAVALEINKFSDGSGKTALALDIFGKSGAQLLPLLKDLAEAGDLNARVTTQQAAEAETFSKAMNKLSVDAVDLKRSMVLGLLPGLQLVIDQFKASGEESEKFADRFSPLTETFKAVIVLGSDVAFVFKGIGREIGGIAAQMAALARGDISGFGAISAALKEDGVRAREELDKFQASIMRFDTLANERNRALAKLTDNMLDARDLRVRKPKLDYVSDDKQRKDDPTKKLLDNSLKGLEAQIESEKDILAQRNRFLDLYNGESLISFGQYYEGRKNAQQENLERSLALYDKEIAALRAFIAKSDKETEKADAQGKINDVLTKKEKLQAAASAASIEAGFKEQKSFKDLDAQINQVNVSILEFTGNLRTAAGIRFDQSTEELRKRLSAEGNGQALRALETQRAQVLAQADLNKLGQEASILADQRLNAETAIQLIQQNGAIGELDSLRQRSEARANQIRQLQLIYEKQLAIAEASGNPRLIQDAKNLGTQLEVLKSQADLVKQSFENIFVNGFSDAFASFISGTKSAKEAFKDFVKSVEQQLAKLAAQDISRSIFGSAGIGSSGGSGGGLFAWLAGFFGSAQGGGGDLGAGGLKGAKGLAFDTGGVRKFALGGIFDRPTGFGYAGGAGLMGEAGPEAVMPLTRDRSGRLGVRGGSVYSPTIHFNISTPDANSFRQSEAQIAANMHRLLSRGARSR